MDFADENPKNVKFREIHKEGDEFVYISGVIGPQMGSFYGILRGFGFKWG